MALSGLFGAKWFGPNCTTGVCDIEIKAQEKFRKKSWHSEIKIIIRVFPYDRFNSTVKSLNPPLLECNLTKCHRSYADCQNTDGSYSCKCKHGFEGDGKVCLEIDECAPGSGLSNCDLTSAYCVNTVGSYDCECSDGYVGDGETCNDIDECLSDSVECADDAFCKNVEGSYICQCRDGFTGNGKNCLG